MKKIFITILILFLFVSIARAETLFVGKLAVEYDEIVAKDTTGDGFKDRTSYYLNNILKATTYDDDKNGQPDLWFHYDEEMHLVIAAEDMSGNGSPDEIYYYNEKEEIIKFEKAGAKKISRKLLISILVLIIVATLILVIIKRHKRKN